MLRELPFSPLPVHLLTTLWEVPHPNSRDSRTIQLLLGQETQRNHLECIVMTRLRWREGLVLPSGHVGAMGDSHLQDGAMNTIQLCLERGVRLEDGLHKTA